jgi:hypothetical protein
MSEQCRSTRLQSLCVRHYSKVREGQRREERKLERGRAERRRESERGGEKSKDGRGGEVDVAWRA